MPISESLRPTPAGLLFYRLPELAVQAPPRLYAAILANPGRGRRRNALTMLPFEPTLGV